MIRSNIQVFNHRSNKFALESEADFIVSGDRHLLSLQRYKRIVILTPAAALAQLAPPRSRR